MEDSRIKDEKTMVPPSLPVNGAIKAYKVQSKINSFNKTGRIRIKNTQFTQNDKVSISGKAKALNKQDSNTRLKRLSSVLNTLTRKQIE